MSGVREEAKKQEESHRRLKGQKDRTDKAPRGSDGAQTLAVDLLFHRSLIHSFIHSFTPNSSI